MKIGQMARLRANHAMSGVLLLCVVVIGATIYFMTPSKPPMASFPLSPPCFKTCEYLAVQLDNVLQELKMAHAEGRPPSMTSLNTIQQIMTNMNPDIFQNKTVTEDTSAVQSLAVCPEVYINRTFGVPYYENEKGWITLPCKAPPLEKLVSIVFNPLTQQNCSVHLDWILKGISRYYSTVPVYFATNSSCGATMAEHYPNVHPVPVSQYWSSGSTWLKLLSKVKTPYVLVARDIFHFTNFSRIERLIRIVNSSVDIPVAGGTTRNLSGHWNIGCYQTKMSNYILEYTEGYYKSKNECMFCDYVSGPFVARRDIFTQIPLHTKLPEEVLFHNFFLQLKNASYKTVNCPDTMHFARNIEPTVHATKDYWIPLARKWELNLIILPKNVKHELSCEESALTCSRKIAKSYLIPICCRKQYLNYLKTLVSTGLPYELRDGDVLAAVKMRGSIPWDTDTDMNVVVTGVKPWSKTKEKLKTINFKSVDYDEWLSVRVPNTNINMDPIQKLSFDVLLPEELDRLPTLVEYDGDWLIGPVSPGLYARNGYGVEILRHVQSYSIYGHSDPYEAYKSGFFLPCPKPYHHACLDHFSTDGNIQFMVP